MPVGNIGGTRIEDCSYLFLQLLVLHSIQGFYLIRYRIDANLRVQCNLRLPRLSCFGSNHNHTIRRPGAVNGCRRSILQYLHTGNVIGRKEIDIIHCYSIYNIQRIVTAIEGSSTTYADRHFGTRRTAGLHHIYSGCLSLQCLCSRYNRTFVKILCRYAGNCRCHILTLLCTIADNHNFVQQLPIFFHADNQVSLLSYFYFFRLITDITENKSCIGRRDIHLEVTIHIGDASGCRTFHLYGHSDHCLSRHIIKHLPFDCSLLPVGFKSK